MEAEMVERVVEDVVVVMTRAQAASLHTHLQVYRGEKGGVTDEFLRSLWNAMGGWDAYVARPEYVAADSLEQPTDANGAADPATAKELAFQWIADGIMGKVGNEERAQKLVELIREVVVESVQYGAMLPWVRPANGALGGSDE